MFNIKNSLKLAILFLLFSYTYYFLEILYDGRSHWTMFVCGGLSGIFGHLLVQAIPEMPILEKSLLITLMILALEYISGYFVNIQMGLQVWDYSALPLNIDGQICFRFALLWFVVFSPFIVWISDEIGYLMYGEAKPMPLWHAYKRLGKDLLSLFLRRRKAF
ncbi:MAG: hypothetical protein H7X94_04730 [Vallitaleaceae bacterium]|nr:hypothetical protein [Vallitaleaceae bacterium]